MECVHCGSEEVERLIVASATDTPHGGICAACETEKFGVLTNEPVWHHPSGCGLCGDDARFAVPRIDCLIEWDDNTVDVEYSLAESTLELCRAHAATLLNIDQADEPSQVGARA